MAFAGFGPDVVSFYDGLEADNSREYWTGHRAVYDEQVAAPLRLAVDGAPTSPASGSDPGAREARGAVGSAGRALTGMGDLRQMSRSRSRKVSMRAPRSLSRWASCS